MPVIFTFDLSQQHFELRCGELVRRLVQSELVALIEDCEYCYYSGRSQTRQGQLYDLPAELVEMGQRLYKWLDGDQGWLRRVLNDGGAQMFVFDLVQARETQALNSNTDAIALRLAHLPWELLHDGQEFLIKQQKLNLPPLRVVQQRGGQDGASAAPPPENRPLHLLLMATSSEYPGIADLQYEQEEANILQATRDQPLLAAVEESGSVVELANLVRFYPQGYFDVFHLTGHGLIFTEQNFGKLRAEIQAAPIADQTPCFITEDELGGLQLTTAKDLARAFGNRFPKLVFLSGCHTGELPDEGSLPSMAQALVQAGVPMVLGWARPVYDSTAIVAAEALYRSLAAGDAVEAAIEAAVLAMLQANCPDWHLLRVYRDSQLLGALVTPLRTREREKLKPILAEQEFLDEQGQVKVAGQYAFVGRRRPLQRCLKALKETSDQTGVFIMGMGGLGKSTLAARLCLRVRAQRQTMQQVVLIGVLTQQTLLQKLSSKYEQFPQIPELLNQPGVSLKGRLQNFFEAVEALDRPLLLVLDDFEQNIPQANVDDGSLRLVTEAYDLLGAICAALAETGAVSRVIVTCRYGCPLPPHRLHIEQLAAMRPADIAKKCRLLPDYADLVKHPEYRRVIKIADGNPRLLEWLLKLLQQAQVDADGLLNDLERTQAEFRENLLATLLLDALSPEDRQVLAKLSLFRLPVTREIADAVIGAEVSLTPLLNLGLVESATTHSEAEYRVPTILEQLLESTLSAEVWQQTQQQAAQAVYKTWWEGADSSTEERGLEIVRLGLLAQNQEIAVTVGGRVATRQVNNSRFAEAEALCQKILAVFQDYRILGTVADAEQVLGQVDEALAHYQQALAACPEDDLARQSATLHNMANVIAAQGDIKQAMRLWNESLQLYGINDVQSKAATLGNMARVIADQGGIEQAMRLWNESLQLLERTGDVQGKAATLGNMARVIAAQGDIEQAMRLWNESLQLKERINDVKGKAATLNNMARVIADQGDIEQAMRLWNESLQLKDRINDVQSKADTLANMAGVIADQGDIEQAMRLWNESLQLYERINNVHGKATTLGNMAYTAGETGDKARQLTLNLQAAQALGQVRAYVDLVTVLGNLGGMAEGNALVYLSQAIWLCLRIQAPLVSTLKRIRFLFNAVPQGDALKMLLAATALWFCNARGEGHPQIEQLQEDSFKLMSIAANAQGIQTQEAFDEWFIQQQLNDPSVFLPQLNQRLEAIIGDGWLFDPNAVTR
ncbi:MAG: tetratricopeptide repeat protein [Pegethrix bostrychoides GSE-TBD4-15B]|jgi:tetratricopeptide (TPR) repeat protein|uniref:Tetratricopeptide repeat protein n=1 Tax=Pegethrix bostrychoides GSE-TBD4-15B TaxID=2839662 RepID=A0A951P8Y4_9CYAN|nr:tetratricopeptide repeat protein [Pegethrix bostrychoides GSE-TBD4-15B]